MFRRLVAAVGAVLVLSGCFHATIETGLPASLDTIERPWALGFIGGLVPPPTVETASKCKNGVAKVETQQSLPNMFVSWLTSYILTPMEIKVTCASSNKMGMAVPTGAPAIRTTPGVAAAEYDKAVQAAAQLSMELGQAVYVTR